MVCRRGIINSVLACLAVAAGLAAQPQTSSSGASSSEAAAVLASTRQALGAEQRLSSIKTLVANGQTRQVQGDNLVPIEFEIAIEFPDKYVRTDEIPARESGPTSRGFNGDALIQVGDAAEGGGRRGGPPPPGGQPGGASPPPGGAPAPRPNPTLLVKQDFAKLTLGTFAASFTAYPLTFGYVGQAEAPEGKAHVLEVKGAGDFSARLFVDAATHLPLMLSWTTPPELVAVIAGQKSPQNLPPGSVTFETPPPPPATATAEEKKRFEEEALAARKKAMASARPAENRIYYGDYRTVDGLKFPFRMRRAVGATTIEETTFDRYRINVKIDPRKFEVRN